MKLITQKLAKTKGMAAMWIWIQHKDHNQNQNDDMQTRSDQNLN